MSRRRISCPLSAQQIWDAVKITRYKKQVATVDKITKYMKSVHDVPADEVTKQLNHCVRDGLLQIVKRTISKGLQAGVEQEGYVLPDPDKVEKDDHDWYCFECHTGGDVICCTSCYRVYHISCIPKDDLPEEDVKHRFVCSACKRLAIKELTPNIKRSQLNRLLRTAVARLKDRLPVSIVDRQVPSNSSYISERFAIRTQTKKPTIDVPNDFKWVLNDKEEWRQKYLIYKPIDLNMMEAKVYKKGYAHLEEFRADVRTIVHNVVIFHGVNSTMADTARLMLRDCNTILQEIMECWLCYKHSNDKVLKNWFCKPCRPPHELVYAKTTEEYPYWPAKVLKTDNDTYEVRFFGLTHDRAVVDKSHIRPLSVNIHTLQVKGSSGWNKACEELKKYQKQLEKMVEQTDNFTKPFVDSSSDSDDDEPETPVQHTVAVIDLITDSENGSSEKERSDESNQSASPIARIETEPQVTKTPKKKSEGKKKRKVDDDGDKKEKKKQRSKSKVRKQLTAEVPDINEPILESERNNSSGSKGELSPESASSDNSTIVKKKRDESVDENTVVVPDKKSRSSSEASVTPPIESITALDYAADGEDHNITSTSSGKCSTPPKRNEEELVSSSSHNPTQRSVKVQTRPLEPSPPKDWVAKMETRFKEEKERLLKTINEKHQEELNQLKAIHELEINETKKKQWCINCGTEAIYHCCWNTSYCSPDCQLSHWATDHKRTCRRKR